MSHLCSTCGGTGEIRTFFGPPEISPSELTACFNCYGRGLENPHPRATPKVSPKEALEHAVNSLPKRKISPEKVCSCGKTHQILPDDAKVQETKDELAGWYFNCECRSTLFVPKWKISSVSTLD